MFFLLVTPASSALIGEFIAHPQITIPQRPVNMHVDYGEKSRFDIFFVDIRYGYDLQDFQSYRGWCLDRNLPMEKGWIYEVTLHNSLVSVHPDLQHIDFHKINYMINHKEGGREDVQNAMWHLIHGSGKLSEKSRKMVESAREHGSGFIPSPGQLLAIVCHHGGGLQPTFIEYVIPFKPEPEEEVVTAFMEELDEPESWVIPEYPWPQKHPHSIHLPPTWERGTGFIPEPPPTREPVPEPLTLLLFIPALAGIYLMRNKIFKGREGGRNSL